MGRRIPLRFLVERLDTGKQGISNSSHLLTSSNKQKVIGVRTNKRIKPIRLLVFRTTLQGSKAKKSRSGYRACACSVAPSKPILKILAISSFRASSMVLQVFSFSIQLKFNFPSSLVFSLRRRHSIAFYFAHSSVCRQRSSTSAASDLSWSTSCWVSRSCLDLFSSTNAPS